MRVAEGAQEWCAWADEARALCLCFLCVCGDLWLGSFYGGEAQGGCSYQALIKPVPSMSIWEADQAQVGVFRACRPRVHTHTVRAGRP